MLAGKRDGHLGLCKFGTVQATMWECQARGQREDRARQTDRLRKTGSSRPLPHRRPSDERAHAKILRSFFPSDFRQEQKTPQSKG